jgi:ribose transport system substrate-binding protein
MMRRTNTRRISRRVLSLLFAIAVLFGFFSSGCRKKDGEGSKGEGYALVPKSIGQIYWEAARRGMEKAAKEENVKSQFTGPPATDIAKQIDIIENLLLQGVAGIAISPNDPTAVKDVIARAIDKGVPVVTFDSDAPDSKRIAYIGTDNEAAGRVAGETLAALLGNKGKVAIITGGLGAHNLNLRIRGFRAAMANFPEITLLDPRPCEDDSEKATAIAENLLTADSELTGFFGVSAPGGPGAARAVKATNKVGKIKIVGFDDTPECRQFIKEGIIQATIAQRPFDMGYKAIKVLVEARKGNMPETKIMDTGVTVITPENIDKVE